MIDSNNKLTSLSRDLINSVRKVMENKPAEKKAEDIQELSNKTMGSYAKKAINDAPELDRRGEALNDLSRKDASQGDREGSKYYKKLSDKVANKAMNRRVGAMKAIDKMSQREEVEQMDAIIFSEEFGMGSILEQTDTQIEVMFAEGIHSIDIDDLVFEDVEDIQELSTDTLKSYVSKAKADPAFAKKKGKPSKVTVAVRAKRSAGMDKAKAQMTDKWAKESAEMEKQHHANIQHVRANLPKTLEAHGYTKATTHEKRDTYTKPNHETGHVIVATVHHAGSNPSSGHEPTVLTLRNSSGWQGSNDRFNVERHPRKEGSSFSRDWSKATTKSEAMDALHGHLKDYEKDMNSRGEHHYESFADEPDGKMLDEAKRGRPRKNPVAGGEDEESEEANLHIVNQLRKAQISTLGGHKVTFADGSAHHVKAPHATAVLNKYADMKPREKEVFQKKIAASHQSLMNEV